MSASKTSARRMVSFIFKIEAFLFIWKILFHLQAVCSKRLMRRLHVQTMLMRGSRNLIKIYTLTLSSDDFPVAGRTDLGVRNDSEYIFHRDYLFLRRLASDTFWLKNRSDGTILLHLLFFITNIVYFSGEIFSGMCIMKLILKVLLSFVMSDNNLCTGYKLIFLFLAPHSQSLKKRLLCVHGFYCMLKEFLWNVLFPYW